MKKNETIGYGKSSTKKLRPKNPGGPRKSNAIEQRKESDRKANEIGRLNATLHRLRQTNPAEAEKLGNSLLEKKGKLEMETLFQLFAIPALKRAAWNHYLAQSETKEQLIDIPYVMKFDKEIEAWGLEHM